MDKHLTEIEFFEYANQLIEDKAQIAMLESHLSNCKDCQQSLLLEHKLDESLKEKLAVDYSVDLSEKVMHHFTQEKSFFLRIDAKGIIYVLLFFLGLIVMNEIVSGIKNITIPYLNLIFSAVLGLFFIELLLTYVKYKKKTKIT